MTLFLLEIAADCGTPDLQSTGNLGLADAGTM